MPTEVDVIPALFLFAHQDDEFAICDRIEHHASRGGAICAYLTDGGAAAAPARRNAESLDVLGRLGVQPSHVHFLGEACGVPDGRLHEHLPTVAEQLAALFATVPAEALVYLPAWEGGHPDHDGLHAVAATLLQARGRLDRAWQFSLYHGRGCVGPFFRVLSPLRENGPCTRHRIPLGRRLAYFRHCLRYPSQWKTWLGLSPFVLLHHLGCAHQELQRIDPARLRARPHPGRLYYEARGFLTYAELHDAIARWLR